jgi:hypothetical protein
MDLISAVRSQQPAQQVSPQPPSERAVSVPAAESTRPVTQTIRRDAVHSPSGTAAQVSVHLAERDEAQHPATDARAAAMAARDAYIKASIAAGLSPLPLP